MGSHVFALVPLASLDQGLLGKHILNPFAQPRGAVDDKQEFVFIP
jgi:hypothetical protein